MHSHKLCLPPLKIKDSKSRNIFLKRRLSNSSTSSSKRSSGSENSHDSHDLPYQTSPNEDSQNNIRRRRRNLNLTQSKLGDEMQVIQQMSPYTNLAKTLKKSDTNQMTFKFERTTTPQVRIEVASEPSIFPDPSKKPKMKRTQSCLQYSTPSHQMIISDNRKGFIQKVQNQERHRKEERRDQQLDNFIKAVEKMEKRKRIDYNQKEIQFLKEKKHQHYLGKNWSCKKSR